MASHPGEEHHANAIAQVAFDEACIARRERCLDIDRAGTLRRRLR